MKERISGWGKKHPSKNKKLSSSIASKGFKPTTTQYTHNI